jgi:hypothetical protein
LNYPDNHIEVDNRLSWFLGRLDSKYGNNATYIHLQRNLLDTANSFTKRYNSGIMKAYREGVLMAAEIPAKKAAADYCKTVGENIRHFLKNKTHVMDFYLEHAKRQFPLFWQWIHADGDLDAALKEWDIKYNFTKAVK